MFNGETFSFFLSVFLLQNLCNLPTLKVSLSPQLQKLQKLMKNVVLSFIHSLWRHTSKFKNLIFLSHTKLLLSVCRAGDVMEKKHSHTFLSLSLSSLCVIYPRGRSSVHNHGSLTFPPPPPQTC